MMNNVRSMLTNSRAVGVRTGPNSYSIFERRPSVTVQYLYRSYRDMVNGGNTDLETFMNETLNQYVEPVHPVPQNVLNNLREEVVNGDLINEKCVICLENFVEGDKILHLSCEHLNHSQCLLEWFREHDTCPTCRRKVE